MRGNVRELIGTCHITRSEDVGIQCLQEFVRVNGTIRFDTEGLQAISLESSRTSRGTDQRVEFDTL